MMALTDDVVAAPLTKLTDVLIVVALQIRVWQPKVTP